MRKNCIRRLLLLFFVTLFFVLSCSAENNNSVPVQIVKSGMAVIKIVYNRKNYRFMIDTGANKSIILKSGIKKLGNNFDQDMKKCMMEIDRNKNKLLPELIDQINNDDYLDENEKNKVIDSLYDDKEFKKYIPINLRYTFKNFMFNNIDIGDCQFIYSTSVQNSMKVDGIIGIDILEKFETIKIDYKKNRFYIQSPFSGKTQCIHRTEAGLYEAETSIDGVCTMALIDTGCSVLLLGRKLFAREKKLGNVTGDYADIQLYLNDSVFEEKAYYILNNEVVFSQTNRETVPEETILGYPILKDNILFMDFKNSQFAIIRK
jgi:hypothetical protein